MPILISNQKQVLDRRRVITDCYICGTALPPKQPGWREQVIADHVVSRTLLGEAPPDPADAWSIKLYVHQECEKRYKAKWEQQLKILHCLPTKPADDWSQEDAGLLLRKFEVAAEVPCDEAPIHAITGVDNAMDAAGHWFRGMHAILYMKALSGQMECVTMPPVPIWTDEDGSAEQGLQNDEARRRPLLNFVETATRSQRVDEIVAWGGKLIYRCAWRKGSCGRGAWACTWTLRFPASSEWATRVRGIDAPWLGYYEINELPPDAAVVF